MIRKILLAVLAAVAIFALVVATRPSTYHVERSISVGAPPAAVFAVVNDFHRFSTWSPWEHLDPAMKKSFEGRQRPGPALYRWEGNKAVGAGSMTILDSRFPTRVVTDLQFLRPFPSKSTATYSIVPENGGAGSRVTWAIDADASFMVKGMQMFNLMDSMLGKDFAAGLANLKRVVESGSRRAQ